MILTRSLWWHGNILYGAIGFSWRGACANKDANCHTVDFLQAGCVLFGLNQTPGFGLALGFPGKTQ